MQTYSCVVVFYAYDINGGSCYRFKSHNLYEQKALFKFIPKSTDCRKLLSFMLVVTERIEIIHDEYDSTVVKPLLPPNPINMLKT